MVNRMVQGRVHIVQQGSGGGNQVRLADKPEAVKRSHLEMPKKLLRRRINGECPAVRVVWTQRLRRTVARHRVGQALFRLERLHGELARGKVEKRQPKPGDGGDVVVHAFVKQTILRDRPRSHYARHLAPNEPLGKLRVLHLIAERGGHAGANELGEVRVQGMVRDAAHWSVASMRKRGP